MRKYILIFFAIAAALIFAVLQFNKNISENSNGIPEADMSIRTIEPNNNLSYSAWIPDWATGAGFSSLKTKKDLFNSISPVWYEVKEDGSLVKKIPAQSAELLRFCEEKDIEVVPSIAMFDHEIFTKVLQSEENFKRHVDAIISEVRLFDYAGVDLDYESTKLSDKNKYFEFLQQLAGKLHAVDKKLVVTVLSQWGDDIEYPSLPETRKVQDWSEIAKYADEIRIMSYDYTSASAQFPGPIAPLEWVEKIIAYAAKKIPPEKTVLGIHLYSYEWSAAVEAPIFHPDFDSNPSVEKPAASYTFETVQKILAANQGEKLDFQGENIYIYQTEREGSKLYKVLVYIDPVGVSDREALATRYGLKGVSYWRLGGEGELLQKD